MVHTEWSGAHIAAAVVVGTTAVLAVGILLGVLSGPLFASPVPVSTKALPEAAKKAAELLPAAFAVAAANRGCPGVRALLFNARLEQVSLFSRRWHKMEGQSDLVTAIAQCKARSLVRGRELRNPGKLAYGLLYMLPWVLGTTDHVPLMGATAIVLPDVDESYAFVVYGAQTASLDLDIAEAALTACGFKRNWAGKWTLKAWYDVF